jgi:hypothetical protein
MALVVRRVDAAVVRPLTAREYKKVQKREKRDEPHTWAVVLPHFRRPLVYSREYTLTDALLTASAKEALRLPMPVKLGRSFWLAGHEVFTVNDLEVSSADVVALLKVQRSRREAQLKKARLQASDHGGDD